MKTRTPQIVVNVICPCNTGVNIRVPASLLSSTSEEKRCWNCDRFISVFVNGAGVYKVTWSRFVEKDVEIDKSRYSVSYNSNHDPKSK